MWRLFDLWGPGVYFNDDPTGGAGGEPGAGGGGGGGGAAGQGAGGGAGGGSGDQGVPKFTQADVNRMMKKERESQEARFRTQNEELLSNIEQLRETANLSDEQKAALAARADELSSQLMTAEQKAEAERKSLETKHAAALSKMQDERDVWRTSFEREKVETAVLAAASSHGAYRAQQVLGLVAPQCCVNPVVGEDGAPTGRYAVSVETHVVEDGKTVAKLVSVDDFVKAMKESEDHANLFVATKPGGSGFRPGQAKGSAGGENLSPQEKVAAGLRQRGRG